MIPLRDTIPSATWPVVTVSLIALNILAFLYELSLGRELDLFIMQYGAVPIRFILTGQMHEVSWASRFVPVFTSMFLHGGWIHVLGNMLYLWIFGDNVEDRLGHARFVIFYFLCGLAATLAQIYLNPSSRIPMVGASGAVAGVLGAYMVLFPHARVLALVPIAFCLQVLEIPAFVFLLFWFFMQFLSGAASITTAQYMTGGVAWWAHVGGFVSGMALGFLFSKRTR
jgi:membrane associated rhomboid family serine protease